MSSSSWTTSEHERSRDYRLRNERVSRIRRLGDRRLTRLAWIGTDPQDDDDTRASKALLVLVSVLILPIALLQAALYLAFGSPVGWVPLVNFAILLAAIVVFSRARDFDHFLRTGQLASLCAPTLSMVPLGGFLNSGAVGLWGILAPPGGSCSPRARAIRGGRRLRRGRSSCRGARPSTRRRPCPVAAGATPLVVERRQPRDRARGAG
jgi:hypothetical protein